MTNETEADAGASGKGGIEGYLEDLSRRDDNENGRREHELLPRADGVGFRKVKVRVVPPELLGEVMPALELGWNGEEELQDFLLEMLELGRIRLRDAGGEKKLDSE